MADTPKTEDPHVRALDERIEAELRTAKASYEEEVRQLQAAIRAASSKFAAARREAARKRRNLRAIVSTPRPRAPKPAGWAAEPPRGNGTASKRKLAEGLGIQDVRGFRGLSLRVWLAAGERGLTPGELVEGILAAGEGEVLERFGRLRDKVKNASDVLYFARENQAALGVRVEKNGSRWRILRDAGA